MRYHKGVVLSTVFILAACYFSIVSFGETVTPESERRVRTASNSYDAGYQTASMSWQGKSEAELNDLVHRGGMSLEKGTSLSLMVPEELTEEVERIDIVVIDRKSEKEAYRLEDCKAGDRIFWVAEKDGRYHVAAVLWNGEETETVILDESAYVEVEDSGGNTGGVILLN